MALSKLSVLCYNQSVVMKTYDLVLVLVPQADPKQAEAKFQKLLTSLGFSVAEVSWWGKKPLAYPIKKQLQGLYGKFELRCESVNPQTVYAKLKMDTQILRSLLLIKPSQPSKKTTKGKEKKK